MRRGLYEGDRLFLERLRVTLEILAYLGLVSSQEAFFLLLESTFSNWQEYRVVIVYQRIDLGGLYEGLRIA
jgi:hypothetical protein